jgi:Fic family protein
MSDVVETPSRLESCLLDEAPPALLDLVADLSAASSALGARLHPRSAAGLADAVRIMNCYYSHLIEGHNTTARAIERALAKQMAADSERRDLQVEARAHIGVQREIDRLYEAGQLPEPASTAFIRWLHQAFYSDAPETMLRVAGNAHSVWMTPGAFR